MRAIALMASLVLAACAGERTTLPPSIVPAVGIASLPNETRMEEIRYQGPGFVCGISFAIGLEAEESLLFRDPQIDFLLYYVTTAQGEVGLYEGNYPQRSDDLIITGLDFPSVIAVSDHRGEGDENSKPFRERLYLGQSQQEICDIVGPRS